MPASSFAVHHITPDGIILQLSDGFGRVTKELCGNDQLAEKMLRHFASCQSLRLSSLRMRDAQGYLCMSAQLSDAWPNSTSLLEPVVKLLNDLYRKNMIVELGSVVTGRVRKANPSGTIFSLTETQKAVAPLEDVSQSTSALRVLDYDVATGLVQVTAREAVVAGGAAGPAASAEQLVVGARVTCRVLLPLSGYSVVELGDEGSAITSVGYLIRQSASATRHKIGAEVSAVVEFAPSSFGLGGLLPFVVLSTRECFRGLPPLRSATGSPSDVLDAPFSWRVDVNTGERSKRSRGDAEDDGRMRRRRMEDAIDAFEREGHRAVPKSPDDFRKLLLATPNSSYLWTQFMAFHLGLQQYEEARQVAEQALKTIGVRESKDLLNVWVALMNIENLHGTAESLTSVFRRALQHSDDQLVVHEKLADIFAASKKSQQLVALCRAMTSKFRNERRVWQRLGIALIDTNKRDQLKRVIKDLVDVLKKDDQAVVIEHLAIHEYRNGNVESGRGLFEGLVGRLPKKSDVWSAFLDQELGLLARRLPEASVLHTRTTFERATSISLPAKVMQGLLTRFLQFEQAYGTPTDVEKVKAKAKTYVESKLSAASGMPE
jgi:rRNA biogenesis protein RRP5